MIKIIAIGHLGKDCIVNNVNGSNVMNFSVAHTSKFKKQDGSTVEKTVWLDCSYWSENTAVAPYLTKGKQVYIEGEPEVRTFQKQDGTTGAAQAVRVFSLQLLGGNTQSSPAENTGTNNAAQNSAPQKASPAAQPAAAGAPAIDDSLPF